MQNPKAAVTAAPTQVPLNPPRPGDEILNVKDVSRGFNKTQGELLVLDGGIEDEHGRYEVGSWVRYPVGSRHAVYSEKGCTLYLKTGHLAK